MELEQLVWEGAVEECEGCDGYALVEPPPMSVMDARDILWRRCKDAGWGDYRTAKYVNKMCPWPAKTMTSG